MAVITWTEIEGLHNIKKYAAAYPEILNGNSKILYRAKVKLHGTNAGIQIHKDGTVQAQSRTTELSVGNDNAGFAKWVDENKEHWSKVQYCLCCNPNACEDCPPCHWCKGNGLVIFGEWVGPGIQKGVALSQISRKVFAVFAARYISSDYDTLIVEPDELQALVKGIPDTYVLPWHASFELDLSASGEELLPVVEEINKCVFHIEANDPWVESTFGVKGTGEGIVLYPSSKEHLGLKNFNNLVFKCKGEKHKNIKTAAPAQVNVESAASVDQFVDMVLTEARLEQGTGGSYEMKSVAKFLAWVSADVQKETADELEASGLTWDQVSKAIINKARAWYLVQAKKL